MFVVNLVRTDGAHQREMAFTNSHLLGLLLFECVIALLLLPWLRRRGWSPALVAGAPSPGDVGTGAALWIFTFMATSLVWVVATSIQPELAIDPDSAYTGAHASAWAAIAVSVINPVFEEFLWLGYGVTRLGPFIGVRQASVLSIALRTLVHAYQGADMLLFILPLGIIFTFYYTRTNRIWPVVVAHMLFDAIGLAVRGTQP